MNKKFCVLPWIHLHSWTNGDVYPCCYAVSNTDTVLGNLKTESIPEVLNSERFKTLRWNMMNNKDSEACTKCYQIEEDGFKSMRQTYNDQFNDWPMMIVNTANDGSIDMEDWKLKYWDIRFSNLCNMKCRTCGPEFSSKWKEDVHAAWAERMSQKGPSKIQEGIDYILEQIPDFAENVEELYFAGGEPLIMQEHWDIIDKLRAAKRYDVKITYQTNLSTLVFKHYNILSVIKDFENVKVLVSMDATDIDADIIRHGVSYKRVIKNLEKLREHIHPYVSITVSSLNAFKLDTIINEFIDKDYFSYYSINPVFDPEYYSVRSLTKKQKYEVVDVIDRVYKDNEQLNSQLESFKNFMFSAYQEKRQWRLAVETAKMDNRRGENLMDRLPASLKRSAICDVRVMPDSVEEFVNVLSEKNDKKFIYLISKDKIHQTPALYPDGVTEQISSTMGKTDLSASAVFWYWLWKIKEAPGWETASWIKHWVIADEVVIPTSMLREVSVKKLYKQAQEIIKSPVFSHPDPENDERVISKITKDTILNMLVYELKTYPWRI